MVADGLTKALGPERHKKWTRMMGMGVWKRSEDCGIKPVKGKGKQSGRNETVEEIRSLHLTDHQNEEWE